MLPTGMLSIGILLALAYGMPQHLNELTLERAFWNSLLTSTEIQKWPLSRTGSALPDLTSRERGS